MTIIPCTDLAIGTWRRIATTVGKHDLVAYVCDVKRCITWFIHSAGFGFKMEIPFDTIVDTEFQNASPGMGLAKFRLSQPPIFYLENPGAPGAPTRVWKRCSDWTEDHQATHVLKHDLIGSAVQLAHVLRNLRASTTGSDIPLHQPAYRSAPPTSPMELPAPPMAGLTDPSYSYLDEPLKSTPSERHESRRLSYHGPGLSQPSSAYSTDSELPPPPHSAPAASFSQSSYSAVSDRGTPASSNFGYAEYSQDAVHHQSQTRPEYSTVPINHSLAPRPFSAQPVPRTFYSEAPRVAQVHQHDGLRRSHSSGAQHYEDSYGGDTPSPPILSTPYHPPTHLISHMPNVHAGHLSSDGSGLVASGLSGMLYESDEDLRRL